MSSDKGLTTLLKHKFYTYVMDDTMSEGAANAGLVDGKGYNPKFESAIKVKQEASKNSGETIPTHWVCTSRAETFTDLKTCSKLDAAKKSSGGIEKTKIALADSAGSLYPLDDNTYIYLTEKLVLTSLTTIQEKIDEKLGKEEYEIHWSACRSKITGATSAEVLATAKDSMAGDPPAKII